MDRQAIADAPFHTRNWKTRPSAILRHIARKIAFLPPLRPLIEKPARSPEEVRQYWDDLMSQSNFVTYLGQTINVDSSNEMTALMIKYHAVKNPSVLDVGCAAGTLSLALAGCSEYLGIDASTHAIECGKRDGISDLMATDLRLLNTDKKWDVIAFNEVLYYLSVDEAVREVERYTGFLSLSGTIYVAMKHDPKSLAIFDRLHKSYRWIDGMIWQRKYFGPDYSIRIDRECPGFLLGVFSLSNR